MSREWNPCAVPPRIATRDHSIRIQNGRENHDRKVSRTRTSTPVDARPLLRQRSAARLGKERRRDDPDKIDRADDDGGTPVVAERGDERAGHERSDESDEARRIEAEADGRGADA